MKIFSAVILILCTILLPYKANSLETYKSFTTGRFDVFFETNYFKTTANFGSGGDKQSLMSGSSLQNINLQTKARYLFFNNIGFYTGLNFNNVENFNGLNFRNNSALTHAIIGGDYQFFRSDNWSMYSDISLRRSNIHIDVNQDEAIASDGADELQALIVGIFSLDKFKSFAKIGGKQRSDGLSNLLLYGLGAEFSLGYYSAVGAEINGISSVTDDQNTNTPLIRDTLLDRVNAGSRMFYSINPNNLEAQLFYTYAIQNNFKVKLSAGTTLTGSNSAEGYRIGLSFNWGIGGPSTRFGKLQTTKPKVFIENSNSISDDDPGFKIDTDDGVNQEIFKPAEPLNPSKKPGN